MNASEPYTDKDLREWEAIVADPDLSREYPKVVSRMLATIRDRDRQIAELKTQMVEMVAKLVNESNRRFDAEQAVKAAAEPTRRAEAFMFYCHNHDSTPESAIKAAANFNAEWEKGHD